MGKQHHAPSGKQSQKQQTPEQPADVTEGTIITHASAPESDKKQADGCPAHPGKLNHTENNQQNPIDGAQAQDQLFDCKDEQNQ